jgi:hypothetical protein
MQMKQQQKNEDETGGANDLLSLVNGPTRGDLLLGSSNIGFNVERGDSEDDEGAEESKDNNVADDDSSLGSMFNAEE